MAASDHSSMTGAQAVVSTLADCGVEVCFANPGTSEMHLVTALDDEPRIRPVLCLFEGVATGAADGFARITGRPALTLLHLGPGYLNGGANIHNARRAFSPMINLIGDHALSHRDLDAPLASDIAGLAGLNSLWLKSVDSLGDAARLAREAYVASFGPAPGPVSLVMPADIAWTTGAEAERGAAEQRPRTPVPDADIEAAAERISNAKKPALLVSGTALIGDGPHSCARLEAAGVKVFTDTFVPRQSRGAGVFSPAKLPYFAEAALDALGGVDLLLVAGTKPPVAFFAYPDTPGALTPEGAAHLMLGGPETDSATTLRRLADAMGASQAVSPPPRVSTEPDLSTDKFTPHTIGGVFAARLPKEAIISDDGVTASLPIFLQTAGAAQHDWLSLMGGAIGQGMPVAIGAAIAAPGHKVVCLTGDGAGMYTNQSLWTMARESLDIVTIVFVNNAYRILNIELQRTGAGDAGPAAAGLLNLGQPEIDWVAMGASMGVSSSAASDLESFDKALRTAFATPGPHLIAVQV